MNDIGNNLRRIRLLRNLSLREVSEKMNISATAVNKYEKGIIIPDSKRIIEFADIYDVKTSQILKTYENPTMRFTSFRKSKSLSGKKLELLESVISENISKYLEVIKMNSINNNFDKIKEYNCTNLEDAELAAASFRDFIGISKIQPLSDLTNILENLGIVIINIEDENGNFNDFASLSEIVDNIPFIVLLGNIKDGARQRFTIAHELGHLVLKSKNNELDEEKLCNRFASSLLMPKEAVYNELGIIRNSISIFELKAFKEEYKVSYSATIYRLKELNIISEYLYKKLNVYLRKNINKGEINPITPEVSNLFKKLVYKLESNDIISTTRACELLGVTTYEFKRENNYN